MKKCFVKDSPVSVSPKNSYPGLKKNSLLNANLECSYAVPTRKFGSQKKVVYHFQNVYINFSFFLERRTSDKSSAGLTGPEPFFLPPTISNTFIKFPPYS